LSQSNPGAFATVSILARTIKDLNYLFLADAVGMMCGEPVAGSI
jgi:hypothetical protein